MGVCPLSPQTRVIEKKNSSLCRELKSQLKQLRIYLFTAPLLKATEKIPQRYLYNEGIIEDIEKLQYLATQQRTKKSANRITLEYNLQDEIRASCLILQNEEIASIQDKQQNSSILDFSDPHSSFKNNLTRNQSIVAQMHILYEKQINKEEYSESLRLFLKWVQYFNEHAYGGFLKPVYQAFCKTLYGLVNEDFCTIIDEISIFVQYMVKIYTDVYHLKDLNQSVHGKLFKNQNVYNLIMSFMFRKTKIKSFIRRMIRKKDAQKIKLFEQKLEQYHKKGIAFFQVDEKFILIDNQQSPRPSTKKQSNIIKQVPESFSSDNLNNSKGSLQKKMSEQFSNEEGNVIQQVTEPQIAKMPVFKSNVVSDCYESTLRLVSQLSNSKQCLTPITKLKTIIAVSKQIIKEIQIFYTQVLKQPKQNIPNIDPDNLTAIIIYLIVKINNKQIYEELKMIQYFTTTNTMNSISGGYRYDFGYVRQGTTREVLGYGNTLINQLNKQLQSMNINMIKSQNFCNISICLNHLIYLFI